MKKTPKIVCFGELLVRISAQLGQRIGDIGNWQPYIGGAEANVGVGLARLGNEVDFIGALSDNELGDAAIGELRRHGINTKNIARQNGRMGLYFLSTGIMQRASQIVYDRENSVFAKFDFSKINWHEILENADLLHISGVTAALGEGAYNCALNAMQIANEIGVKISYDCNYRPKLWENWSNQAPQKIKALMQCANIMFASYRDIQLVFGNNFADFGDEKENQAAEFAFKELPNLEIMASTPRVQISASINKLGGIAFARNNNAKTDFYDLDAIVDRIGSGDAFAAGLLHGLLNGEDLQKSLLMGVGSACLKHSQNGDFCLNDLQMLEDFTNGQGLDVKR
jgi:2-dehydro-3-deoxygluconokinase